MNALIVEDDPSDLLFLTRSLHGDFELRTARTLSEAKAAINQSTPDVILLDLQLPDSHYPDTLKQIAGVSGRAAVVIVSGNGDYEFVRECMRSGANGFLFKNRLFHIDVLDEIKKAITNNEIENAHLAAVQKVSLKRTNPS